MSAEPQMVRPSVARLYNIEAEKTRMEAKAQRFNPDSGSRIPHPDEEPPSIPKWLRPFFSLRWRLTFVYAALFGIFILLMGIFISYAAEHTTLSNLILLISIISLVAIVLSALLTSLITGIMLRPLKEMNETARSIALGDFSQRVRLPGGDDEIGNLAASFNNMVDHIERAFEVQRTSERRAHRFISSASHELRTPLTSIRGLTEVLIRGAKDNPETMQRVLRLMKNESERMTRLVNDMLTLARLDEGRPLQYQPVDLLDIAVEGVEQARVLAGSEGSRIKLDLVTENRLIVQGDLDRLKQVIFILFDNAIKYGTPPAGKEGAITLRLDRQDAQTIIQVIDNGSGIDPEDLPHVFERFYRGQHVPPYKPDGSPITGAGLGLSIAHAIVRAHNGEMSVVSERGKGSTFTVKLPCK
jgi:two-component system OmpR family sensor kinase